MSWSRADIPDLSGRRALVTGATDGLGFETALALAGKGATVIASGRDPAKGETALGRIRERHPQADVTFEAADLSDLQAVRAMAARLGDAPLDILMLNAGLMALPERRLSAQGFEMQLAVNYLAHFALTGWLLEPLGRAEAARVIAVSSLAHWPARLRFDDPSFERGYNPFAAYAQSKLAMLTFAFELQRRSDALGWGVTALAAHPGVSRTNLMASMAREGGEPTWNQKMGQTFGPLFSQDAAAGADPQILAATAPCAPCGGYWGPEGLFELRGAPAPAKASARASDPQAGARLWALSQDLTGGPFPGGD